MAFIESPTWAVEYLFKDNNDNVAGVEVRLLGTLTFTAAQTAAEVVRAALVPLSDARLYAMSMRKSFYNDDATAIPASAEVERKLSISYSTQDGIFFTRIEVPSPVFTIEQTGTDAVNPANALVLALTNAMTNTGVGGGNSPVTVAGQDLTKVKGVPTIIHRRRKVRK